MMKEDFASLNIDIIQNLTTELNEGKYHKGKASIIRVVGTKL
jgi:hypothetical protein